MTYIPARPAAAASQTRFAFATTIMAGIRPGRRTTIA
jgi:hypothetical protein